MTNDLIARTSIDVSIALDTLMDNIYAFLEKESRPSKAVEDSSDETWREAEHLLEGGLRRNLLPSPEETASDRVTDMLERMTKVLPTYWEFLDDKMANLAPEVRRQAMQRRHRLNKHHRVAKKLVKQLKKNLRLLRARRDLKPSERTETLLEQADLLGDYTHMWTIYEKAWMQRYRAPDMIKRAVQASDAVVHDLYREIEEDKNLKLKLTSDDLITVFFESRLITRVSKVPAPYIVAPYWGIELVWNWLSFGHEVGHHAYANVGEEITEEQEIVGLSLGKEIRVHVAAHLLTNVDQTQRQIWYRWTEEIFADLFGLLLFGPASARSMQHMFFHLPPKGLKRFLQPAPDHWEWLLRAEDSEHPPPYLRVYLALEALDLLAEDVRDSHSREAEAITEEKVELEERWECHFGNSEAQLRLRQAKSPLPLSDMRATGRDILDIMLHTPLYALVKKSDLGNMRPRKMTEVFFDPEVAEIEAISKNLDSSDREKRKEFYAQYQKDLLDGQANVRHLMAALPYEFERITRIGTKAQQKKALGALSADTIKLLVDYAEERQG